MELSDLESLQKNEERDEGGELPEERPYDGASSYTSGTSDSEVWYHQAASEGNLPQVKHFIEELKQGEYGRFQRERDRLINYYSALHIAARYNQKEVVEFLLDNDAQIEQQDEEDENTALLLAVK
jgi:Ankyrin repeat.